MPNIDHFGISYPNHKLVCLTKAVNEINIELVKNLAKSSIILYKFNLRGIFIF